MTKKKLGRPEIPDAEKKWSITMRIYRETNINLSKISEKTNEAKPAIIDRAVNDLAKKLGIKTTQ